MIITALIEGFIWSALWIIYVYVIVKKYPWEMLHDYPKDIQEAAVLPKTTNGQKRNAKAFSTAGVIVILGSIIAFSVLQFVSHEETFWRVFVFVFIIAMTWNVVDLLVMDWLVICVITPRWVVIPGTEGCKGYKDYMFHFKGFLVGCVYTTIASLIIAGIEYTVLRLLIW